MKWNAFTQFSLEVTIYIALLHCVKEFISLPISKLEANPYQNHIYVTYSAYIYM